MKIPNKNHGWIIMSILVRKSFNFFFSFLFLILASGCHGEESTKSPIPTEDPNDSTVLEKLEMTAPPGWRFWASHRGKTIYEYLIVQEEYLYDDPTRDDPGIYISRIKPSDLGQNITYSPNKNNINHGLDLYRNKAFAPPVESIQKHIELLPDRYIGGYLAKGYLRIIEVDEITYARQVWHVWKPDGMWIFYIHARPNEYSFPAELLQTLDSVKWKKYQSSTRRKNMKTSSE